MKGSEKLKQNDLQILSDLSIVKYFGMSEKNLCKI